MPDELVDILEENGKPTGEVLTKKQAHKDGLWHAVAHVWILNSKGQLLIQRRADHKSHFPGLWDISVGGHLQAGDTVLQGVLRETEEEIGIKLKPEQLIKIEVRKIMATEKSTDLDNKEYAHVYLCKLDINPKKIKFQKEEIAEVKYISLDELEKELRNPEQRKKFVPHETYWFDMIELIKKELR